ncbi:MAG: M20/M25/M40 family metallo-hydrolase [Planctomycetota bacterium]
MQQSIRLLLIALALGAGPTTLLAQEARGRDSLTERYRSTAGQILGAALVDTAGYEKLVHLTTEIGHRLSGSRGLERAIEWSLEAMRAEGLSARAQPVMVPHWVRGRESAEVVGPGQRALAMLGLGGSVGTGPEGILAPVVVVRDFDGLAALGRAGVEGKIVVFAVEWQGYGRTVAYRSRGASRAAELGALAVLVRSATGSSLYTPHTGALRYADGVDRIPAAAITVEDALWMRNYSERGGELTVRLRMEAETLPDAPSANVIAEIRGRELPEEVVVMGGHFDSWDVGHGAHDDGAPCMAAWHALTILHQLGLQPRRTLRVVLWTNEENGGAGGRAYRESLGDDVSKHVAAIEMDGGMERPVGFGFTLPGASADGSDADSERAMQLLREISALFDAIDASEIRAGGHGADITPLMNEGVPGLALHTIGEHYFDWHHTNADTLDMVDLQDFRKAVALLGVMGYVLADMPETLAPR